MDSPLTGATRLAAKGPGSETGQAATAHGSSGTKGDSGATALGGKRTEPGRPVTHKDIVAGRIPAKNGYTAPAVQIR
ncbi:hypothetical protein [Streptomyces yerevanensis]|uniref:hypothetical protein n=1 Tax=Streptomyces yerevanensis TaxID=66378 RepID=UPI0005274F91|nr:hypothetical protein [Streptomyces yerevanensis]